MKYNCKQCDMKFHTKQAYAGHMSSYIKNGKHISEKELKPVVDYDQYKIDDNLYQCCDKVFTTMGIRSHYWRCHGNGINHRLGSISPMKGKPSWNKGLTKQTDSRLKKSGETYSQRIKSGDIIPHMKGKNHKQSTIDKLKVNSGGYREGSGRGKKGYYMGYRCDSTWELAWIIYNLDNGNEFDRNNEGFQYEYNGSTHKYYPDFILPDNTYIEIKGIMDDKNIHKIQSFQGKLIVLTKKDIEPIIKIIKTKYNINDLTILYDNSNDCVVKHKPRKEYLIHLSNEKDIRIENRKKLIRESNIDFKIKGWSLELSILLNITRSKSIQFIRKYMISELNPYFTHKTKNEK